MIRKYHNKKTAENHMAPQGSATQQSWDTWKTNSAKQPALSLSHQDGYKIGMDIK